MTGGPLTAPGRALLDEMARIGFVLDLTHMSDESAREALARYDGVVVATHANARGRVVRERLLARDVVTEIAARDGVIGVLPLNWALDPDWSDKGKAAISVDDVAAAVDALCDAAGDIRHIGIGTDFDGGQGAEATPAEIDTIADLPKLGDSLRGRGYSEEDIRGVMGENWLRLLRRALPSL
jgi:membrane dipeptidase